jgi:hypothetical protein
VLDEFVHFYDLVNFGIPTLLLTPHGGHLKFFSNLPYIPLYRLFGLSPAPYYALALATHLLNVALCYRVAQRLSGRALVAVAAATLWGCAAVNLGAIGWFDVYGQLLVTTIVLLLLLDVTGLAEGNEPSYRRLAWWALLLLAACGSFGNGLAIAALFFPVVTFMLDGGAARQKILARCAYSILAVSALYVVCQCLHALSGRAVLYPASGLYGPDGLAVADVFTVPRVLLAAAGTSVGDLFVPWLLHIEDGKIVAGPLQSVSRDGAMLAAGLVLGAWSACCLLWLRRRPHREIRRVLGLGVLAVGCYGLVSVRTVAEKPPQNDAVIAFVRTAGFDEGMLTPVSRVTRPRYQYLPSLLLILVTVTALPASLRVRPVVRLGVLLWVSFAVLADGAAVYARGPVRDAPAILEAWLRRQVSAFPPGSTVYVDNGPPPIVFAKVDEVFPGRAALALLFVPQFSVDGRRVYFVEHDRQLLARLRSSGNAPIGQLVIGSDDVPSGAYYRPRPKH